MRSANDQKWEELLTEIKGVDIQVNDLYDKRNAITEELDSLMDDAQALVYSAQLILLTRLSAEG